MTQKEQNTVDSLLQAIKDLRTDNTQYREYINKQVENLSKLVEHKHVPLSLEENILQVSKNAIQKSINDALSAYDSPLKRYITVSISKYETDIIRVFQDVFKEEIHTEQFKEVAKEEILRKVVKSIISGIDGSVDKVVNQMKQDSIFRSKLTLTVNTLVEEFLNK
jgi:hypothetical protein